MYTKALRRKSTHALATAPMRRTHSLECMKLWRPGNGLCPDFSAFGRLVCQMAVGGNRQDGRPVPRQTFQRRLAVGYSKQGPDDARPTDSGPPSASGMNPGNGPCRMVPMPDEIAQGVATLVKV